MNSPKIGIIFNILEFTVHDGPGLRTTVFLKGCPLDCSWCHNPEGKSSFPQIMQTPLGERQVGETWESSALAERLNRQAFVFHQNQGGVTFSGGEPLMQAAFIAEVIEGLDDLHTILDTSGYANENDFCLLAERVTMVFFDLKLLDESLHRKYTGMSNGPILHNLTLLSQIGTPFVVRVPLIPGVTDTANNLNAIARWISRLPTIPQVELLPYNSLAGAKYASCGKNFEPNFDPLQPIETRLEVFSSYGLNASVRRREYKFKHMDKLRV